MEKLNDKDKVQTYFCKWNDISVTFKVQCLNVSIARIKAEREK